MAEVVKETITTTTPVESSEPVIVAPVKVAATNSQTVEYLIYFLFGVLDILLVFRLFLKLLGASTSSAFVRFVYQLSAVFTWPFEGIFHRAVSEGIETASVFEPATMVAIVVYMLVAWGIVVLVRIFSGERQPTE